ncbi:unnamed protein product, partial [Mesorhabditis spiculigera]
MNNQNLMREVKLWENNAEREQVENMGELFAVLNALECLEKMFVKDFVTADEYKTECFKLLDQYKVAMRLVHGTDVEAFVSKYRLQVPAALERIREGRPVVVKDDKGNLVKNVAGIVEIFITVFDHLKLEQRAVDELFPSLNDLYTMICAVSRLPENFDAKVKVKKWHDKLSVMSAADQLSEDEARQMLFELEGAYNSFINFLHDAALGFHIVVTLIVVCILSKCSSRVSFVKWYIIRGLYRYLAPSNDQLRALMPAPKDGNPRQRRKRREEQDSEGFNVPKQLLATSLQVRAAPVDELELTNFEFYTSIYWMSLYTPLAVFVYTLSEVWKFVFPTSQDTNVSVLWLIIGVAFILQILTKLTAFYWASADERGLLLSFGALYFLSSIVVSLWADRLLDINLLGAYDHFTSQVAAVIKETGTFSDIDARAKSPLMLYISLSVFFSFLSTMLVFPNFRFATLYTRSLNVATPTLKILLHISFLMPALCLLLFLKPVKYYLIEGPRKLLTEPQLEILRVYLVLGYLLFRMALRRVHLQSHLDLSYDKLLQLQKETGHVKNYHLQTMIFRYYSYFCAAVVQYFVPVLLSFFFALLLKSTADLSWLGHAADVVEPKAEEIKGSPQLALRVLFDATVCKAVWSFALVVTTGINFSLSLIGVCGLGHIAEASSRPAFLFWLIVFIVLLIFFIYEFAIILIKYLQKPARIDTEIYYSALPFPVVTVCNTNPYKYTVIQGDSKYQEVADFMAHYLKVMNQDTTGLPDTYGLLALQYRYDREELARDILASFGRSMGNTLTGAMYAFEELITECTFSSRTCYKDDFVEFVDPLYGRCFSFNTPAATQNYTVQRPGMKYGLKLLLTVNQQKPGGTQLLPDFLPTSDVAGARVALTDRDSIIDLDSYGFSAGVGYQTSIGMFYESIHRAERPYGHCIDHHAYSEAYFGDVKHSMDTCIAGCIQEDNVAQCGCASPRLPKLDAQSYCGLDKATCLAALKGNQENKDAPNMDPLTKCGCDPACEETKYSTTASLSRYPMLIYYPATPDSPSQSPSQTTTKKPKTKTTKKTTTAAGWTWPSWWSSTPSSTTNSGATATTAFTDATTEQSTTTVEEETKPPGFIVTTFGCDGHTDPFNAQSTNTTVIRLMQEACREWYQNNALILQIYFADLIYNVYTESAAYSVSAAINDLGGQAGLWLGLSVISCIEVASFFLMLCMFAGWKTRKTVFPKKRRDSLSDEEMDGFEKAPPLPSKVPQRPLPVELDPRTL